MVLRHSVERMLRTLKHAGKFDGVAGIVVGACVRCDEPSDVTPYTLNEILDQVLGNLGLPVFSGLVLGHTEEQLTLLLGVEADGRKCMYAHHHRSRRLVLIGRGSMRRAQAQLAYSNPAQPLPGCGFHSTASGQLFAEPCHLAS